MSKKNRLFEKFPPVTTSKWMEKIRSDLKGADFNSKMIWKTGEGFDAMPFYRRHDLEKLRYIDSVPGSFPYIRGNRDKGNSWRIRQDIIVKDYLSANRKALDLLTNGVDSLGFIISDPGSVNNDNLNILLKGIAPGSTELNFYPFGRAKELMSCFDNYLKQAGTDKQKVTGAIEADPLTRLMLNGTLCIPVEQGFDYLAEVSSMTLSFPQFRAIHLNGAAFRNSGGNIVQELAFSVSAGKEYLVRLEKRGIPPELGASKMRFSFSTGSDYFLEIAKLRAARFIWAAVMDKLAPGKHDASGMIIHCVTRRLNKTGDDPYINILRTQTEAMSAILGGTDSLTVEPFDLTPGTENKFSERIARNQQLILKEESYFDKVADPAGGSYYIENLTYLIADAAWKLFLEIENNGGFLKSLIDGFVAGKINDTEENSGTGAKNNKNRIGRKFTDVGQFAEIKCTKYTYNDLDAFEYRKAGFSPPGTNENEMKNWITAEGIPVKPVYYPNDIEGIEHLEYAAGIPPFSGVPIQACI